MEIQETREENLQEAIEMRDKWMAFVNKNDCWLRLKEIFESRITRTQLVANSPSFHLEEILPKEFNKGEIAGMQAFLNMPALEIERLSLIIDKGES